MEKNYETRDLYEASSLLTIGRDLIELKKGGKDFVFIFKDQDKCNKIANEYWQGKLIINAKAYTNSIKELKDRLYAGR